MSFDQEGPDLEGEAKKAEREKFITDIMKLIETGQAGYYYHSEIDPKFKIGEKEFHSDSPYSGLSETDIKGLTAVGKKKLTHLQADDLGEYSIHDFNSKDINEVIFGGKIITRPKFTNEKRERVVKKGLFGKKTEIYDEQVQSGDEPIPGNELLQHGSSQEAYRAIFHGVKLEKGISDPNRPGHFAVHALLIPDSQYQRVLQQIRRDPASIDKLFIRISPELTEYVHEEQNVNGKMFVALPEFSQQPTPKGGFHTEGDIEAYLKNNTDRSLDYKKD